MKGLEIKYNSEIRAAALEIIDKYYKQSQKQDFYSIISQLLIASMMEENQVIPDAHKWLEDMCQHTKKGYDILMRPNEFKQNATRIK